LPATGADVDIGSVGVACPLRIRVVENSISTGYAVGGLRLFELCDYYVDFAGVDSALYVGVDV
jgi:hypothetical protein